MAALGAGAGAHRGDMERAELDEKRRQADMQNRQSQDALAQRGREFAMNLGQRQSEQEEATRRYDSSVEMTEEQNRYQRGRNEQIDSMNVEQKQYERGRFDRLDKRQEERDTFDRERLTKSDGWADVLNALTEEHKKQQLEESNLTLTAYREAAQAEKDQIAKREEIAKSNFGALVISALENGGVAPLANINLHNNAVGSKFTGAYFTPDGGFIVDEKGEDGQVKSNYHEQSIVNVAKSYFFNEPLQRTSGRVYSSGSARIAPSSFSTTPDLAQGKFDLQRGESLLKNLERRIDALKGALGEASSTEEENQIKAEMRTLQDQYSKISNTVYADILGNKGADGGGGGGVKWWTPGGNK